MTEICAACVDYHPLCKKLGIFLMLLLVESHILSIFLPNLHYFKRRAAVSLKFTGEMACFH